MPITGRWELDRIGHGDVRQQFLPPFLFEVIMPKENRVSIRKKRIGEKYAGKYVWEKCSLEKEKKQTKEYWEMYNHKNIMFRLNQQMSAAIHSSLRGNNNSRHWETLVGYTLDELRRHIEKQFTDGMTWQNRGKYGWHIDHIIPQSVFNFTKPEHLDFKKCWALSNLQPMWAKDNRLKSNKLKIAFQPSFKLEL